MKKVVHSIEPVFNNKSQVLILGSFPSVVSRKEGFFYAHLSNRFWKVISNLLGKSVPVSIDDKEKLLLDSKIALWDVINSCEISGSSDSSISNVVENDIRSILVNSNVKQIFTNGQTAKKYYDKYVYPNIHIKAISLPSTSSANALYSLDKLIDCYQIILKYIS